MAYDRKDRDSRFFGVDDIKPLCSDWLGIVYHDYVFAVDFVFFLNDFGLFDNADRLRADCHRKQA
jgi:hypothetical protein